MLCAPFHFASPGAGRFLSQKRRFNSRSFPTIISREHYTTVEEKADRVAFQGNLLAEGVSAIPDLYDGDGLQASGA